MRRTVQPEPQQAARQGVLARMFDMSEPFREYVKCNAAGTSSSALWPGTGAYFENRS